MNDLNEQEKKSVIIKIAVCVVLLLIVMIIGILI